MTEHAEWDSRYSDAEQIWSGNANEAVVAELTGATPGRALDVGCGEGADAIWLARHGWTVTGLDVSRVALGRAKSAAEAAGVTVEWVHSALLEADLPDTGFDLVTAAYAALLRAPAGAAVRALLGAVAPGGTLLFVHHADFDLSEAAAAHGHDVADYVSPDDVAAALGDGWQIERNERRPRSVTAGAGAGHTTDIVLRARRTPLDSTDAMTAMLTLRQTVFQDVDDDGRVLATNDDSGSMQLVEVAADGTMRRLTDLGEPVTGRYLPGSRTAVVSVDPSGSERTQLWLLDLAADGLPDLQPLVADPEHIHQLLDVTDDAIVYATNRRDGVEFDIIRRSIRTGDEVVLYDKGGSFEDVRVSPDGSLVAATRMTLVAASAQLLLIETSTGAVRELSDATVAGDWAEPTWLPGGDLLVSTDSGTERFEVRRWHAADGSWSTERSDPEADLLAIPAPDGATWAVVRSSGAVETVQLHREAADPEPVLLPAVGAVTMYNPIRWSPTGTQLGFTFSALTSPPEAYTWSSDAGLRRRTTSNPPSDLPDLIGPEFHRVASFDGEPVPLFVVRGPRPSGSAVVHVHGGPEGQAKPAWNPNIAALALDGHTVVVPNVRGSAGYGRRWLSLDDVEKRLDSVKDLAAIRDWLPSIDVDPERVALMGGSYGGYMTLAGLTFHPGLWTCGVDIVGMSSLVTFLENTSAYRRVYREREYGSLERDREALEAASPLNIIDRLSVPLFVIHGANDPRVPLSEAEQVTAAVRSNGAECELLVYDDEGHGLVKRKNRLDAYPRAAQFLRRHLS